MQRGPDRTPLPALLVILAILGYILIVAIIVWRVGWLRPAGITRFGGWQVWLAALVLRWGSIWPGVILYTLMAMIPIIPTDFTHTLVIRDFSTAYVRLALFELPLVLFGIWLLLRTPPARAAPPAQLEEVKNAP